MVHHKRVETWKGYQEWAANLWPDPPMNDLPTVDPISGLAAGPPLSPEEACGSKEFAHLNLWTDVKKAQAQVLRKRGLEVDMVSRWRLATGRGVDEHESDLDPDDVFA